MGPARERGTADHSAEKNKSPCRTWDPPVREVTAHSCAEKNKAYAEKNKKLKAGLEGDDAGAGGGDENKTDTNTDNSSKESMTGGGEEKEIIQPVEDEDTN